MKFQNFRSVVVCAIISTLPIVAQSAPCDRIVSLAPSITEILVELGLEGNIVGVTSYDNYPPSIADKSRVGGFLDTNTEAIIRTKPTILFSLAEGAESLRRVKSFGLQVDFVEHRTIKGILDSIGSISRKCAIAERGVKLVNRLEEQIVQITKSLPWEKSSLRVLVVVGRDVQAKGVGSVYISGHDGFYHELLELAGGRNAYDGPTLSVPTLSSEGLSALKPDVIFEMVGNDPQAPSNEFIIKSWRHLSSIPAVKKSNIKILRNDYVTIPGPRFLLLLEDMVRAFKNVKA